MAIDTHIHLFTRTLPQVTGARHNPAYDATLVDLQAVSAGSGVERYVAVQPSFLGYDNAYLLEQIRRHPTLLTGVAVLDPATTDEEIAGLRTSGIRGMRLNLLGRPLDRVLTETTLRLVQRCAEQGLHVEVHDHGQRLPHVLDRIAAVAKTVVIDHFGRPDSEKGGLLAPTFETLLRSGEGRDWYVKISAPYRCPGMDVTSAYQLFRQRWGVGKLLWGSDWPWTQHESLINYSAWCKPFDEEENTAALLDENAQRLFDFPAP